MLYRNIKNPGKELIYLAGNAKRCRMILWVLKYRLLGLGRHHYNSISLNCRAQLIHKENYLLQSIWPVFDTVVPQ